MSHQELAEGSCPHSDKMHEFRAPQNGDSRSPCPALNTLANHGYLPRDGKNIGVWGLVRALKEGYNLSTMLACLLSFGGVLLLGQLRCMSLIDLARHGLIEHNASLGHDDDVNGAEYAPTKVDKKLLHHVCAEGGKFLPGRLTLQDAARIRVKRESACGLLDGPHAEIARGEIAIAIGILGGKDAAKNGVDIGVFHNWMQHERLPADWKPDHTQGLYQTYKITKFVREHMRELRAEQPPKETVESQ
ncbi:Cloroperoxidase [Rhizopogon vinicolor AM-OR11-026]|uniref:Cloroperoxidase n=1 Tax=Rhizopogon vinicolor AM-OR11-026 TaxID=1314800 RepID=A0A1B7N7L1_9AGAM|nr:Cloroperoxidase [Rhizopogon vinicolor AM-OR11-026]